MTAKITSTTTIMMMMMTVLEEKHQQFGGYPFLDTFFLRCDWTRPNQNKTRLAEGDWVQPNGDKKIFQKRPY